MFWVILLAFLTTFALTWLILVFTKNIGFLDRPTKRSSHITPTPHGGGLSFVITFLTALGLSYIFFDDGAKPEPAILFTFLFGGSLVAIVGLLDDRSNLPVSWRLLSHALAALVVSIMVGIPTIPLGIWNLDLGWWGLPLIVLAIVWVENLFNFMDGIDGIAGVEVLTVAGGAILILLTESQGSFSIFWMLILIAGVAGFMLWNWSPARIFMGNTASVFLGFSLAAFAVITSLEGSANIWTWLILLGVFFVDATFTLLRRMQRRERWYLAHRSHAYQKISQQLASDSNQPTEQARARAHRLVCYGVIGINVFWLLPWAWLSVLYPGLGLPFSVTALLPLVMVTASVRAGETR